MCIVSYYIYCVAIILYTVCGVCVCIYIRAQYIDVYIYFYIFFVFVCNSVSVTIGPPENIWVTPGEGSLIIRFSPPFDVDDPSTATFFYHVHYWEKEGRKQARAFFGCRYLDFLFFGASNAANQSKFLKRTRRTGCPSITLGA